MSRTTKLPILLIFISLFFTSYQAIKAQDDEQTADQELMDVLWSGDPEARKSVLSKMSIDKALELMRLVIAEEKSDDFRRRTTARLALAAIRDELGKRKEAVQPLIAQFRSLSQRQSNDEEKPTDELELLFYVLLIKEHRTEFAPHLIATLLNKKAEISLMRARAGYLLSTFLQGELSERQIDVLKTALDENDERIKLWIALTLANQGTKSQEVYASLITHVNDTNADAETQKQVAIAIEHLGLTSLTGRDSAALSFALENRKKELDASLQKYKEYETKLRQENKSSLTYNEERKELELAADLVNKSATCATLIRTVSLAENEQTGLRNVVSSLFQLDPFEVTCHFEACMAEQVDFITLDEQSDCPTLVPHSNEDMNILPAFKKLGPEVVKQILIDEQRHPDRRIHQAAVAAIGLIGEPARELVPVLIQDLHDDRLDVSARRNVVNSLGSVGSASPDIVIPELINAHKSRKLNVEIAVASALEKIAYKLAERDYTHGISMLKDAKAELDANNGDIEEVKISSKALGLAVGKLSESWKQKNVVEPLTTYGPYALVPTLYLSLLVALYFIHPLGLLWLNSKLLTGFSDILPGWMGGKVLKFLHVSTLSLQYKPRVLDAWVERNAHTATNNFNRTKTVEDRAFHLPRPVIKDGRLFSDFGMKEFQAVFHGKIARVLIKGEGGAGKTSLACQIAKWAMADDPSERLCGHRMLPVLVEEEFSKKLPDGKRFFEAVRRQLQELIGESEPIPEELLERLLRERRILVIVDHFSEMTHDAREEIQPAHPEFPFNSLVFTSRNDEKLGVTSTIEPYRIEGNRLSSFMDSYLTFYKRRDEFTDVEFFDYCGQLSRMIGERKTTPLLIILYARQMIAAKSAEFQEQLPENIPDLMLRYLSTINASVASTKASNREVHRDMKLIAWQCLRNDFKPQAAPRQQVLVALGPDQPEQRLSYLEERLHLIQTVGAAENRIRFTLDPLAEYLAALHLVDTLGADESGWKNFFETNKVQLMKGGSDCAFLVALRDCCMVHQIEVPY